MLLIYFCLTNSILTDDILNFYAQGEKFKSGLLPYKDFQFEFPPLAIIFFTIPALFTSDLGTYAFIYGLETIVMATLALYFLIKIAEKMNIDKNKVAVVFIIFYLVYYIQALRKFDTIPMMLTTLSLYFYVNEKSNLAYATMMIGALVKIYPLLLIPIFLIMDISGKNKHDWRHAVKGMASCTIVGAVTILPLLMASVSMSEIFSFISYHSDRGFQIESLVGVIVQALSALGLTTSHIVPSCYTYDVISPVCDALLPFWAYISMMALIVAWGFVTIVVLRSKTDNGAENITRIFMYSTIVLLTFVLTNKVFSTQYIMWFYPFLAVLIFIVNEKHRTIMYILSFTAVLLSFAISIGGPFGIFFIQINLIRDAALILLLVYLVVCLHRIPPVCSTCNPSNDA